MNFINTYQFQTAQVLIYLKYIFPAIKTTQFVQYNEMDF